MNHINFVIPVFNEPKVSRTVTRLRTEMATHLTPYSITVIDDGSTDPRCLADYEHSGATYLFHNPHAGKASALIAGTKFIPNDIGNEPCTVVWCDADLSTPSSDLYDLACLVADQKCDIAIGSRGMKRTGANLGRHLLAWGMVQVRRSIFGMPFADTQCGYKAMNQDAALRVFAGMRVFCGHNQPVIKQPNVTAAFDVEFLLVAMRLGMSIIEHPVTWWHQPTKRVNVFRDAIITLDDLMKIREAHKKP